MNGTGTEPRKTEREIFLAALERTTPGERAVFLDVATGREIRHWRLGLPGLLWKCAISPDEQCLFALGSGGTAQLCRLGADQSPPLPLDLKQIRGAAFSPDGRWPDVVSVLGVGQLGHGHGTEAGRSDGRCKGGHTYRQTRGTLTSPPGARCTPRFPLAVAFHLGTLR